MCPRVRNSLLNRSANKRLSKSLRCLMDVHALGCTISAGMCRTVYLLVIKHPWWQQFSIGCQRMLKPNTCIVCSSANKMHLVLISQIFCR